MNPSRTSERARQINVFQPSLGERELGAVREVFDSNWIGRGQRTADFEERFAKHLGSGKDHVRTVSCCTEGLFQAISLLGIGPGDEVVLPTVSFVGMGNAVAAHGATPVFCDVDARTLNATAETVRDKLSRHTKAVMLLHYGGLPCDLEELATLCDARGLALIEDSACSVSSTYRGRACGTVGDIGVWSFDAMKILVTGDGGMMHFRDSQLSRRAEEALYLGLQTASGVSNQAEGRWWEFEISSFGRRAIVNDIASAIGCVQLERLPSFIARRREIHARYNRDLSHIEGLRLPPRVPADRTSSYYFYWVQTEPGVRDRLGRFLRDNGVYTTFRYYPLHRVDAYGSQASLPAAEAAAASTLDLPIHQAMSDSDVERVVKLVWEFFAGAR
jgi:aminotransferase